MSQLNFHKNFNAPTAKLSVLQKLVDSYKLWHQFLPHFPKTSRYSLGSKIDSLFVETIKAIVMASYSPIKEKIQFVRKASTKLDLLKFFLQIAWEIKALDSKKYIILSEYLQEVGRMLGGWTNQLLKKTSAKAEEER